MFLRAYGKVLPLILTMIIGAFVPQASQLSFLVQSLLMGMLFFAFLDMEIRLQSFQAGVLWVLLANVAVAFTAYVVFSWIDPGLGQTAFITAIAPTAIASTVIVGFIQGRVDFMAAAVLVTNVGIALVIPFILPYVVHTSAPISSWQVLQPVLVTVLLPLIAAQLVPYLPGSAQAALRLGKRFSFPLWLLNLFIVSAKASEFIRNENTGSWAALGQVALVSLVICVANFSLGALLGGRTYRLETSQALGQKNNAFVIWIALTFINPLAAMGPTFYVIYHNLYNTWQIYRFERRNREAGE